MGTRGTHTRRGFIGGSIAALGAGALPAVASAAPDDGNGVDDLGGPVRLTEAITPPAIVPGAVVRTLGMSHATAVTRSPTGDPSPGLVFVSGGRCYNGSPGNSWLQFPIDVPVGATLVAAHVLGALSNGAGLDVQMYQVDMFAETTELDTFTFTEPGPGAFDVLPAEPVSLGVGATLSAIVLARSADNAVYGMVYQYLESAPQVIDVFTPVSPFRAFDSRLGAYANSGRLAPNGSKVVGIEDGHDDAGAVVAPDLVPPGATAVTYNLTVAGATGPNFVAITPGDATEYTASAINFQGAGAIANAGTVALDANRQVKLWGGDQSGSMHTIIDITGYWSPEPLD